MADERGATAVEFALVLPVLVVLLFGIIEFSIAYNRMQGLHAAAREGARVAALPSSSQSDIQERVMSALSGVPLEGAPTIIVTPSQAHPCEQRSGLSVSVVVRATTGLDIPLWGTQSITITGKGEFRCE